jgi:hypothetical protein
MEGRYIAVGCSVLIFIIVYIVCIFYTFFTFSNVNLKKIQSKLLNVIILSAFLLTPVLAMFIFNIGGIMEKGNGISWGCCIEDFVLGSILIWSLCLLPLLILTIAGLIKPANINYINRKQVLYSFLFHNAYTLFVLMLMNYTIRHFSIGLSGIDSSCL